MLKYVVLGAFWIEYLVEGELVLLELYLALGEGDGALLVLAWTHADEYLY